MFNYQNKSIFLEGDHDEDHEKIMKSGGENGGREIEKGKKKGILQGRGKKKENSKNFLSTSKEKKSQHENKKVSIDNGINEGVMKKS